MYRRTSMRPTVTFKIIPHYETGCVRVTVNTSSPINGVTLKKNFDIPSECLLGGVTYPTIDVLRNVGGPEIVDILDNPDNYKYSIHMVNNPTVYYNEPLLEDAIAVMKQLYDLQHRVKMANIKQADKKFIDCPPKPEIIKLLRDVYEGIKEEYENSGKIPSTTCRLEREEYSENYKIMMPIEDSNINRIVCYNTIEANLDKEPYLRFGRTFRLFHVDDYFVYYVGGGISCTMLNSKPRPYKAISNGIKIRVDSDVVKEMIMNNLDFIKDK